MPQSLPTLASQLGAALLARQARLSTAESCTGGALAAAITAIAGCSQWFEGGFITYSNHAKQQLLGISPQLLDHYGAVSQPVAQAMASQARLRTGSHYALATTGVAGPSRDDHGNPLGRVWIAWASPQGTCSQCFHFTGNRHSIQHASVQAALTCLLAELNSAPH